MMTWQMAGLIAGSLIAAGLVLLAVVILVSRKSRRRAVDEPAGIRARQARQDVQEAMDELAALAGRIDQRIEQRLNELSQALAEADAKVALVRSILADQPEGRFIAAQSSEPASKNDEEVSSLTSQQADVLRLNRQGLEPVEIARRTGLQVGEVELTLNLLLTRERSS